MRHLHAPPVAMVDVTQWPTPWLGFVARGGGDAMLLFLHETPKMSFFFFVKSRGHLNAGSAPALLLARCRGLSGETGGCGALALSSLASVACARLWEMGGSRPGRGTPKRCRQAGGDRRHGGMEPAGVTASQGVMWCLLSTAITVTHATTLASRIGTSVSAPFLAVKAIKCSRKNPVALGGPAQGRGTKAGPCGGDAVG